MSVRNKIEVPRAFKAQRRLGQRGATLIEYVLLLALVTLVCIGAMQVVGVRVSQRFSSFSDEL